jgi:hypothetical protein
MRDKAVVYTLGLHFLYSKLRQHQREHGMAKENAAILDQQVL